MAPSPSALRRRLALVAGGAILLAGGAGAAYATSLQHSSPPVESGYATVVEGDTEPGQAGTDRECPERSDGGSPAPGESSAPSEGAPSEGAPSEGAPSEGDL